MIQSADRAEILLAAWANRGLTIHRLPEKQFRGVRIEEGQTICHGPYATIYRGKAHVATINYEWYPEREEPE